MLTATEFKNTFGTSMADVTTTAEPVVDIWHYVVELVKQNLVDSYVYENNLVEKVYRNNFQTFDHVLLPTDKENVFITLVVDLVSKKILGHFKFDLNKEYS
jgi:hypothetical protein